MLKTQLDALIKRARDALGSGKTIAVMGWRNNHHTPFTRDLPPRKVRFYEHEKPPKVIGETIGLVIFTKYLSHKNTERVDTPVVHAIPIVYRTIIQILESCKDVMDVQTRTAGAQTRTMVTATGHTNGEEPPHDLSDAVLELLTKPRQRRCEMDKMEKFAQAFMEAAKANPDHPGTVSKVTLGKIRAECGVEETNIQLVRAGWIGGEISEGRTHVGRYHAARKMNEISHTAATSGEAPEDPYELAKWLIARKPALLEQKAKIEGELAEIAVAEDAVRQLEALRRPGK